MRHFAAALIVAGLLAAPTKAAHALPDVGQPVPALVVTDADGARWDLAQSLGKVVILNFWASWCAPCREEMPALDAFSSQYQGRGVTVVGISVDRSRDRDAYLKAAKAVHYATALLSEADTNGFGKPAVLPVTVIVDQTGHVRAVLTPQETTITAASLAALVQPLLVADGQVGDLLISHPWARATVGSSVMGAAYLSITNRGGSADRLLRVSTPVAAGAALHANIDSHGVMEMRPLEDLALAAGTTTELKPGGLHIMLTGLKQPLRAGTTFPLTLVFEKAGPVTVAVAVGAVGATAAP